MVPRWSLPAMTKARRTPGMGSSTTCSSEVSHWPAMPVTSSRPAATSRSMSGLRPIVPISTTSGWSGISSTDTSGATPVTRPMSSRRSPTTRITPGKSVELTTSGAATPSAISGNVPSPGDSTTYEPVRCNGVSESFDRSIETKAMQWVEIASSAVNLPAASCGEAHRGGGRMKTDSDIVRRRAGLIAAIMAVLAVAACGPAPTKPAVPAGQAAPGGQVAPSATAASVEGCPADWRAPGTWTKENDHPGPLVPAEGARSVSLCRDLGADPDSADQTPRTMEATLTVGVADLVAAL